METDQAYMDAFDGDFAAPLGEQYGSLHRRQQEQMLQHYQRLARQREAADIAAATAAAAAPPPRRQAAAAAAAGDGFAGEDDDEAAAAEAAADAADAAAAAAAVTGVADDVPLDLPEGINLEEARMLEAAMLGIPYQGRMPDFSNAAAAAAAAGPPLSPGAMEQRSLRAEQDAAYEESLALDRCVVRQLSGHLFLHGSNEALPLHCAIDREFETSMGPSVVGRWWWLSGCVTGDAGSDALLARYN
jgi:hypothetical protein